MLRYKEIKIALMEEIAKLRTNERLPSRPILCNRLATTRTTLDKAINELVAEGVLHSKNGSGTYVTGTGDPLSVQSGSWGIIVPNVMESIYPALVRGIENVAQQYNVNIILCNSDNNADKQEQYIRRLIQSGVSGFIIVPVISNDVKENFRLYSQLTEAMTPFVFCNRSVDGISVPVVTSNDFYGGYIATKHLIQNGYRNIAYISRTKYKTSVDRCQGYISALIENGIEVNRRLIVMEEKDKQQPEGYNSMKSLLTMGEKIDAVFGFNDQVTQGVYLAIQEAGLAISDDIGVIGYDNTEICERSIPKITSLAYKNVEIGEKAAEVLWSRINGQISSDFDFYLFQPEIIVRDSCLGKKRI